MKNNQHGRSMIEMIGVLTVMGVLSVGGISGYTKAISNYRANASVEEITTIIANIKNIGMRRGHYKGLNNAAAIKLKAVPESLIQGSSLKNIYSGNITIGTSTDTSAKGFYVQYDGLSKDSCISIITKDWGKSNVAIMAQGTSLNNPASGFNYNKDSASCSGGNNSKLVCQNKIISPSEAITGCTCGSNNSCSIAIWAF